jgi:hypothetical protein
MELTLAGAKGFDVRADLSTFGWAAGVSRSGRSRVAKRLPPKTYDPFS